MPAHQIVKILRVKRADFGLGICQHGLPRPGDESISAALFHSKLVTQVVAAQKSSGRPFILRVHRPAIANWGCYLNGHYREERESRGPRAGLWLRVAVFSPSRLAGPQRGPLSSSSTMAPPSSVHPPPGPPKNIATHYSRRSQFFLRRPLKASPPRETNDRSPRTASPSRGRRSRPCGPSTAESRAAETGNGYNDDGGEVVSKPQSSRSEVCGGSRCKLDSHRSRS